MSVNSLLATSSSVQISRPSLHLSHGLTAFTTNVVPAFKPGARGSGVVVEVSSSRYSARNVVRAATIAPDSC